MKNIWFVSHATMPPHLAVRMRTNNFAKYLAQKGYRVNIFSASTIHNTDMNLIGDKKTLYIESEHEGVTYNHIRASKYAGSGASRIFNLLQFSARLYRVAGRKKEKPDVIICNPQTIFALIPYFISRKYGAKFIPDVRDLWPESFVAYGLLKGTSLAARLLYLAEKWIYKKADRIIFAMEGGKDYIIAKGWDRGQGGPVDLDKVFHINNGVELAAFDYNREHHPLDDGDLEDESTFKVVYTGSIRLVNKVEKILDAAKLLRGQGIRFLLWGDGDQLPQLRRRVEEEGIDNVLLKGAVNKKYIPSITTRAQLNIMLGESLPLFRYGGSMNKMFDYFAAGKPTLFTFKMGYSPAEKYHTGLELQESGAEAIAEAVLYFKDLDEEAYDQYCRNARRAADDYDAEKLAGRLADLIGALSS